MHPSPNRLVVSLLCLSLIFPMTGLSQGVNTKIAPVFSNIQPGDTFSFLFRNPGVSLDVSSARIINDSTLKSSGFVEMGGSALEAWIQTSNANAPTPRNAHTAVWTGVELVVWGGVGPIGTGSRLGLLSFYRKTS